MKEREKENSAAQIDSAETDAGDVVETAGETTAAAMISGPVDTKPVGADTMLKVSDESQTEENAKE